jgi:hypothetical protein
MTSATVGHPTNVGAYLAQPDVLAPPLETPPLK